MPKQKHKTPPTPPEIEEYLSYDGRVVELKSAIDQSEGHPIAMVMIELAGLTPQDVLPVPTTVVEVLVKTAQGTVH